MMSEIKCRICGQTIYYGLWQHEAHCAQQRQEQADEQHKRQELQRKLEQFQRFTRRAPEPSEAERRAEFQRNIAKLKELFKANPIGGPEAVERVLSEIEAATRRQENAE